MAKKELCLWLTLIVIRCVHRIPVFMPLPVRASECLSCLFFFYEDLLAKTFFDTEISSIAEKDRMVPKEAVRSQHR